MFNKQPEFRFAKITIKTGPATLGGGGWGHAPHRIFEKVDISELLILTELIIENNGRLINGLLTWFCIGTEIQGPRILRTALASARAVLHI